MKTIAIINQKGGVAKSATAHAIAAGLKRSGGRVLLVDLDAQGNLTYSTGATADGGAWDALTGHRTARDAAQTIRDGDILAASPTLSTADIALTDTDVTDEDDEDASPAYYLRDALKSCRGYDYAVIDTPPSLGVLTVNALTAADFVLIPAQTDAFSVQGVYALGKTIDAIRAGTNKGLKIAGVLACRFKGQTRAARAFLAALGSAAEAIGSEIFRATVRECTAIAEAAAMQLSIFDYAPKSNGAADYAEVTAELLERMGRA